MAVINLLPPVVTQDVDLHRVQQRFEGPVGTLITTPWGDGVLIKSIGLAASAGNQSLTIKHGLGRKVTGAVIWNCNVAVYGPWGIQAIDNNKCTLNINLPSGAAGASGTIDIWVG